MLVAQGITTPEDMDSVLKALPNGERNLSEYLVEWGYSSDADIIQAIGRGLKLPKVSVDSAEPDPDALSRIPSEVCQRYLMLPVEIMKGKVGNHLVLAMANPLMSIIQQAARFSDLRIKPFVASARSYAAIGRCYQITTPPGPDKAAASPRHSFCFQHQITDELNTPIGRQSRRMMAPQKTSSSFCQSDAWRERCWIC